MKIKTILRIFVISIGILTVALNARSSTIKFTINHSITVINNDSSKILHIEQHVKEIQSMDLSALSPAEKKNVRSELKHLLKDARSYNSAYVGETHTGIYISVGALIIIILLLILILR